MNFDLSRVEFPPEWKFSEYSSNISGIVGKVLCEVVQTHDEIRMLFSDGSYCRFYHDQDCCEYVTIEDVNGDWNDLIGYEILVADERSSGKDNEGDHETWTFYCFRCVNGSVDVRWHGESNGYYSESVDFQLVNPSQKPE